jgi:predicted esterase
LFVGHSNGGGMAADFNQWAPDRVGGYISSHGNGATPGAQRALDNPGLFTAGENDPKISALGVESTFVRLRMSGAHVALAVEQGGNHPMGPGSLPLFLFWLQHIIDERLPQGAKTLQPIDQSLAWWADNATWKDGITAIQSQ